MSKTYTEAVKRYRESEKGKETYRNYASKPENKARHKQKYHERILDPDMWAKYKIPTLKFRAKKKNLEFNLTEKDLIIPLVCPVFGFPLVLGNPLNKLPKDSSPSVDRNDHTKGYTKDNITIMSTRANILKRDATLKELEMLVAYMRRLKLQ